MLEIKAIGIGGIGCALLPFLCRYLQYSGEKARITLIDGDRFERVNASRQAFGRLGNKAEVKAQELAQEFENLSLRAAPEFVTLENVSRLIREGDVIFLMVDNHASRKLVSDHAATLPEVTLISGGNDFVDGNVQVYLRREGRDLTPSLSRYHPEIAQPQDRNPAELSCEELMAAGAPQLLFTNLMVASMMLNVFYAFTRDR
ncbi:MAG: ThiF family adenylyltransferase, partial [Deltaproteobacteria bacterium]|nr:ThiF family adenylyltransferase [Deltaproteobacteria bacterium]